MALDPKMAGYKPLEFFRATDHDRSHRVAPTMKKGDLRVFPETLAFGLVAVTAGQSDTQKIFLTNKGYETLPINKLEIVGDFMITGDAPTEIASGALVELLVRFTPKAAGSTTGGLYIDTGNAAGREFIVLTGAGI